MIVVTENLSNLGLVVVLESHASRLPIVVTE